MKRSAEILKKTVAVLLCASSLLGGNTNIFATVEPQTPSADEKPAEGSSTWFKADLIDFDRDKINQQSIIPAYESYVKAHNGSDESLTDWDWNTVHEIRRQYPVLLFSDWGNGVNGQNDMHYPQNAQHYFRSHFYEVNENITNLDDVSGENAYNSLDAGRRFLKNGNEAVACQGLVDDTLGEDGLPQFNLFVYNPFDTNLHADDRVVYHDVDTEFLYEDGYYLLDSDRFQYQYNAADHTNRITGSSSSGFFPLPKQDGKENIHFGMKFTTDFTMNEEGTYDGKDCVFEFSGDDDVWVYVDGKLALDLGGIHERCSGKIDFGQKKVIYNCAAFDTDRPGENVTCKAAGSTVDFKDLGLDGVCDNGKHTLQFFYLERGGGESNCKIKFNLPTINTNQDIKGDYTLNKRTPDGSAVAGAGFILRNSKDEIVGEEQFTDASGQVTFYDLTTGVYKLTETTVPEGYSGDGRSYTLLVSGNASDKLVFQLLQENADGTYALVKGNTIYNSAISTMGVEISKSAKLADWESRLYDIRLKANACLKKKSVTENPVDVVLVLDASGSMYFPTSLQPYSRDAGEKLDHRNVYYFVAANEAATVYKVVYRDGNWRYYDASQDYMGGSKNQGVVEEKIQYQNTAYGQKTASSVTYSCAVMNDIQFYTSDNAEPRIFQLQASAKSFVESLAEISEQNRIGLVYFNKNADVLLDGELLELTPDNVEKLNQEIDSLTNHIAGGTRQDLGMQYAVTLVENAIQEDQIEQLQMQEEDAAAGGAGSEETEKKEQTEEAEMTPEGTGEKEQAKDTEPEQKEEVKSENNIMEENTGIGLLQHKVPEKDIMENLHMDEPQLPELLKENETSDETTENVTENDAQETDSSAEPGDGDIKKEADGPDQTVSEPEAEECTGTTDTKEEHPDSSSGQKDNKDENVKEVKASEEKEGQTPEKEKNDDNDEVKNNDEKENTGVHEQTSKGAAEPVEEKPEASRNRYVVLLSDGCPNGTDVMENLNGPDGYATLLKQMDKVKVISVGIDINSYMTSAQRLLEHAASEDENGNKLYFAGGSSKLGELFSRIKDLIIRENWEFEYHGGVVKDYIDSRFELVSCAGGQVETDEKGTYVCWNVGTLKDWTAVIRVKAKEDYLGGNAVDTNGTASGVQVDGKWYYFERPKVNVRLVAAAGNTSDTIFLGQTLARYFTQEQMDCIFVEQKKDRQDAVLSYSCVDEDGQTVYVSGDDVPQTFANLASYVGSQAPQTDTSYHFNISASPNIADGSDAAVNAANAMSTDGTLYTASMQDASDRGAARVYAKGRYDIHVIDGTVTVTKKYDKEFLENLPYTDSEKELIEAEQSAVFTVERYPEETSADDIKNQKAVPLETFQFAIHGADSQKIEGLRAGVYRIVEEETWSWKYHLAGNSEEWADGENNFFQKNDFSEEDGIFYLGKCRDGVREETFACMKNVVENKQDTEQEHYPAWFADTTHVRNELKSLTEESK